jgi:ribosome-associated toxin RatA of RatAB toxin-antitoxin module
MRTALVLAFLFLVPLDQVRVTMRAAGDGPKEGIGEGIVEAPPERVFRAVSDLQYWNEFMPFVQQSDARPQADGSVLSFQRLDLPVLIGERHYEIRARSRVAGRTWSLDWSYVPGTGNVKAHRGSWTLTDAGAGRTRAILKIYTDPGGAVPDFAMDRATEKSLGWIFKGLRQQVKRWRYAVSPTPTL